MARAEGTELCGLTHALVTGTAALMGRYFAARRARADRRAASLAGWLTRIYGTSLTAFRVTVAKSVASRARTMKRSGAGPMYVNG